MYILCKWDKELIYILWLLRNNLRGKYIGDQPNFNQGWDCKKIECERINTKPHYQNKTRAAALNRVFTCTQCTVYVQYMCINSAAWNKTAKAKRQNVATEI